MRIVKWAVPLALLVAIIVVSFRVNTSGIKPNIPEGMVSGTAGLYYFNETTDAFNAAAIAAERRAVTLPGDSAAAVRALLEVYLSGPEEKGLSPLAPASSKVLWTVKNGDWAGVCFDSAFLTGDAFTDELALCAVVMTLCDMPLAEGEPPITGVSVYVDDVLQRMEGDVSGVVTRESVTLKINAKPLKYTAVVYFPDTELKTLTAEERTVDAYLSLTLEYYIMEELMKGPVGEGLVSAVPDDVSLLSVNTEYGTCYVNLSGEALAVFESPSERQTMFLYSIVNSLANVDGVYNVVFLIDGRERGTAGIYDLHTRFGPRFELVTES